MDRLKILLAYALVIGATISIGVALIMGESFSGFLLNLGTEIAGAALTFYMLDYWLNNLERKWNESQKEYTPFFPELDKDTSTPNLDSQKLEAMRARRRKIEEDKTAHE